MESSHFYQLLQQQLGCYSSLAAQSTHGSVAAIHEWNPSLHLNNYDYDRYMNEILPNSVELLTKSANFPNMEFDECKSCPNPSTVQSADDINENDALITSFSSNDQVYKHQFSDSHLYYSNKTSWACPVASSSNNYVFAADSSNLGLSTSCLDSTHLAIDFTSYLNNGEKYCTRLPKENLIDSSYSQSSSSSNKTIECRNKATSKTKRVLSTSSQRRSSHDEAAKKRRAVSQSLPKVGKEKIGDRIAALHRLVAPFGKTDAASVLTEAIGYIQFLHDQIQTLSMPCIKSSQNEGRRCFQGVFSNQNQKEIEAKQDLRNRGLCLVPSSIASYISSSCAGLDGI